MNDRNRNSAETKTYRNFGTQMFTETVTDISAKFLPKRTLTHTQKKKFFQTPSKKNSEKRKKLIRLSVCMDFKNS
jgi:hypothetical protein